MSTCFDSLSVFGVNQSYFRGKLFVTSNLNRTMLDVFRGRIFTQIIIPLPVRLWPNRSWRKATATIRAAVMQHILDACSAKGTLKGADHCLDGIRRQWLIAVFTSRPQFEHVFLVYIECLLYSSFPRRRKSTFKIILPQNNHQNPTKDHNSGNYQAQ